MKRNKYSINEYLTLFVPINLCILIIIGSIFICIINGSFNKLTENTIKGLIIGNAIILISSLFFVLLSKNNTIKKIIDMWFKRIEIEKALISINVYTEYNEYLVIVPKISINTDKQLITIEIPNPYIRSKLENHLNLLSSALPSEWIVDNYSYNQGQNVLLIEYFDTSKSERKIVTTPQQFIRIQEQLPIHKIQIMPNTIFDIKKTPHMLVTGSTNGGKSYFVLNNIVASALIKNWKVTVLDYKSQYHILDEICRTAYTTEDILKELRSIKSEMSERKKALEPILRDEFSAVAYEHGFPVHLVIIEEYVALLTSGIKKEVKNEIEEIILNLAVLSRSLGFCLCLITQQSGSNVIPTSLRSQLQFRLLLGSPSQSIYECTFEDKSKSNVNISLPIGCGLYCDDGVNIKLFRGFTFNYEIDELFRLLSCKE